MFCFAFRNQLFYFITAFLTCQALFFIFIFRCFCFATNDFIYYHKFLFVCQVTFFIFLFQTFFELVCSLVALPLEYHLRQKLSMVFSFFSFFCNFILFRRFFTSCYRQPLRLFFRQTACVLGARNDLLNCIYLFSFFYKSCIASLTLFTPITRIPFILFTIFTEASGKMQVVNPSFFASATLCSGIFTARTSPLNPTSPNTIVFSSSGRFFIAGYDCQDNSQIYRRFIHLNSSGNIYISIMV